MEIFISKPLVVGKLNLFSGKQCLNASWGLKGLMAVRFPISLFWHLDRAWRRLAYHAASGGLVHLPPSRRARWGMVIRHQFG